MEYKEDYAFWDLIAEEAYNTTNATLRKGTFQRFWANELHKNIYLFGCNDACRTFIRMYGERVHIAGIFDNSKVRWNSEFEGYRVLSPEEWIPGLGEAQNVIIIAMRLSSEVIAGQLDGLGFHHYYALGVMVAGMKPYEPYVREMERQKKEISVEDIIMLESTNDFDGNAGALYDYLKSRGCRYRFVWVVKDGKNKSLVRDARDIALCPEESLEDLQLYLQYRNIAKWQIWDNSPIRKVRREQTNVFLQHFGMGYKKIGKVYRAPDYVDYVLSVNRLVYEMEKDALLYAPGTKVIYGELPRNDVLFQTGWNELGKIVQNSYSKVVMWAPTLRQLKTNHRMDSDLEYPYGISLIYHGKEMEQLNAFLADRNMLLLVKVHPRQEHNYNEGGFSNIIYLTGENAKSVHAYKLLTQVDAMISDYSSIVFDYMLLNRPIAWALDDMEHYQIEFMMDDPLEFMPGEKLYHLEDLFTFLSHVYQDVDLFAKERAAVSEKCNAPACGRGCEHIAEVLEI